MKVKELIAELQKVDGESRVFMGYDGNMVVTKPSHVEILLTEKQLGEWCLPAKIGDTVILCDD
jgi:hypothetical protein